MKLFFWASVLFMSAPLVAAADSPARKATPAAPAASAFTWTGCYAGASVGASGARAQFQGLNTSADDRARLGAQAGCNFQIRSLVVGGEGELGGSFWRAQRGARYQNLAARAGYAFDRTLVFGKIGAAFARSGFGLSVTEPARLVPIVPFAGALPQDVLIPAQRFIERTSQDRVGLLLGGGVEYAINRHWSLKGEIDYVDFGARAVSFTGPAPRTLSVRTSQTIGDIGVNYRF